MDFVEIRFDGTFLVDRDDVEEGLNESLKGIGEVTGAGSGEFGAHLDVEVGDDFPKNDVLDKVFAVLKNLEIGDAARVRPGDGERWIRLSEWRFDE
ncbi:hypothetical protein [Streptomyces sp. NPDC057428]|uniref:hypothetical protein n=1 Tax=Streptomyces sp. NPDC057428 TaxID=3346129 RepID=UPI0036CA9910